MRLVFVSHSLPPASRPLSNIGGMQRVALELHSALEQRPGISFRSIILRSSWRLTPVRAPLFLIRAWLSLWWRARRGRMDVVVFSSMVTAAIAVPLQGVFRRSGVKTAAIVHGLDVTTPFGPYQRFVPRVFAALDLVLPVSEATGRACMARGLKAGKMRSVRNGVDTSRFGPLVSSPSERRALALGAVPQSGPLREEGLLLLSVGRHVRRKGFGWFVRHVMPLLPGDVCYWIVGSGPETPAIAADIEAAGLGSRVRLLGRVTESDLCHLYRGADLFVMPNLPVEGDMEGFGVVLLEAGLGGLPSIASRLEGIAEVITQGANGHLVEPGDAPGFADVIEEYRSSPQRLHADSEAAHRHTLERFGWNAVADDYVGVFRALAQGSQPQP